MNLHKVKKVKSKNLKAKFNISSCEIASRKSTLAMTKSRLFILFKKIKNNFIVYYLILANGSPRKLAPYYHTFIYTFIRKIAQPVIKLQQKISHARFVGYLPNLTKRGISAVVIIAMIFVQVMNVGAFEAHVVNVTAFVVNDIPAADPAGGQYCTASTTPVNLSTTLTDPSAVIIYTTDGSDPVCLSNGTIYSGSIIITTTTTLKAATCHDGKQSAINTWVYNFNQEACGDSNPGPFLTPETCDGSDNDLNGIVDDVYETKLASSSPNLTRSDTLFNVTASTTLSDDIYAIQTNNSSNPKYIYLNWVFPQIATTSLIATSTLSLEHHEDNASTTVEWWDGSAYQPVCNPPVRGSDLTDSCDLSGSITFGALARNVALRLKVNRTSGTATEYLDWANLKIEYNQPVNCGLTSCGNGVVETGLGETCDDGNTINQDGCSSTCQTEPATSCVKINEIYYDVNSGHGSEGSNEWVELYNACNFAVNLNSWTIKDNGTSVSASTTILDLNLVIHNFAILSPASTTWAFWNIPVEAEEIELGDNIGSGAGLSNIGDRLTLKDNNGIIADQVSYGTDHTYFNLSLIEPSSTDGLSIARIVKGIDTDTAADWAYLANPNPGTNPHPRVSPQNFIDIIVETEVQAELIPTAASTLDSISAEENPEPDQPAEELSEEEIISPNQEIIELVDEVTDATETANGKSSGEANDLISEPEPAITEPAPEPTPTEEPTVVIEAPKEPATEPAAISTELTPNSETTTL